jgi:hypothetical protein
MGEFRFEWTNEPIVSAIDPENLAQGDTLIVSVT